MSGNIYCEKHQASYLGSCPRCRDERKEALKKAIIEIEREPRYKDLESILQSAREELEEEKEGNKILNEQNQQLHDCNREWGSEIVELKRERKRLIETIKAMEKQGAAVPQLTCNQEAYRRMFGYPPSIEPQNITVMERDKSGHVEVVRDFPAVNQERSSPSSAPRRRK